MSIDKLIAELDKEQRNVDTIKSISKKMLTDYIGVCKAYIDLLETVKAVPEKTKCITSIIKEIMNNVLATQHLIIHCSNTENELREELDKITGEVLRGECTINELIEQFESLPV